MLQRHETLPSGLRMDRDWWHATKLGIVIAAALAAAYAVHLATPLDGARRADDDPTVGSHRPATGYTLRVDIDRGVHDRAAAVLRAAGLDTDDAVRTLFVRIAEDGELPYRLFPPGNAATANAARAHEQRPNRD